MKENNFEEESKVHQKNNSLVILFTTLLISSYQLSHFGLGNKNKKYIATKVVTCSLYIGAFQGCIQKVFFLLEVDRRCSLGTPFLPDFFFFSLGADMVMTMALSPLVIGQFGVGVIVRFWGRGTFASQGLWNQDWNLGACPYSQCEPVQVT